MLHSAYIAVALSALALANATPFSTDARAVKPSTDAVDATVPAFLNFCEGVDCTSCQTYDLTTAPTETCIVADPPVSSTLSYNVTQPSGEELPFNVFVGPAGCSVSTIVRAVNECFNIQPGARAFADYYIIPK